MRDVLSDDIIRRQGAGARFQVGEQVERLGGAEEFYGGYILRVVQDFFALSDGYRAHTDVVFLVGGGRD